MDAVSILSSIPSYSRLRRAGKHVALSDSIWIPSWGCAYDFVPESDPCILFEDASRAKEAEEVVEDDFPELLVEELEEFEFPVYSPTTGPCFGSEDSDLDTFRLSPEAIAVLREHDFKTVVDAESALPEVEVETVVEAESAVPKEEVTTVVEAESAVPKVEVETVVEAESALPKEEVTTVVEAESALRKVEVETVVEAESALPEAGPETVALSGVRGSVEMIDLTLEDSSEEEEKEELPRKRARIFQEVIVISDDSEIDD
jgi:hypothetical protein